MNYYYLVAGLPNIGIADTAVPLTPDEVAEQILDGVGRKDRRLLALYLHRHDNANLLTVIHEGKTTAWEPGGLYTRDELCGFAKAIADDAEAECAAPRYMRQFLRGHFHPADDAADGLFADSRLADAYYKEAMACGNATIAAWFEEEMNLGNLLTAANCRRLGIDVAPYIIGTGEVAHALRTSTAPDWGLTGEVADMEEILAIAADTDALAKERRLDDLRWRRTEEAVTFRYFSVEQLFAYIVKIDIIRRWLLIDAEAGEAKLRAIIAQLKAEVH